MPNVSAHSPRVSAGGCSKLLGQLTRLHQMLPNELLYRVNDLILEPCWALRYPHREIVEFLGVDLYPLAVEEEKHEQSGYGNSLVTVLKRVILDHEIKENTGLANKGWVQSFARKRLKRSEYAAFKYIGKPGGEIGNWLIEREVFLCESEGKVLHVRYCNNFHYSLPNRFSTSPYSRTAL